MGDGSPTPPATFGGPGWTVRAATHGDDVQRGDWWAPCGVTTEWGRIRSVLLSWPSERFSVVGDADESLFLSWPDLNTLRRQCEETTRFFEEHGVRVHVHRSAEPPPMNYLFMRDLIFMCGDGAVLARPASPVRAPEVRWAQAALAELGVPILCTIAGEGTLEGADCLWIGGNTVLVGVGTRTNVQGAEQLRGVLSGRGVDVQTVSLPTGVQHLLGVFVMLDSDLAMARGDCMSPEILSVLQGQGIDVLLFDEGEESGALRGMNGVTFGPREVVIPTGCPGIEQQLRDAGVTVHSLDVGAYIQAAGALGCMTAILHRD